MQTRFGRYAVELSNLDKVLFTDGDITKGDLIDYYRNVAEVMLPHAKNRPLTLHRFPDGIEQGGFFQQRRPDYTPHWVDSVKVERADGKHKSKVDHLLCNNEAALVYIVDQATITLHGWLSRRGALKNPDRLLFDLDPTDDDFSTVVFAAQRVRELMQEVGFVPYVMTTGSRGLHVTAALNAKADFDSVRRLARDMAEYLAKEHPDKLTVEQRKNKRKGRLYLDVMRNAWGQTSVLPYSARAKPGAPVATPIDWDELTRNRFHSQRYTIKNVLKRLSQKTDPWVDISRHARGITQPKNRLKRIVTS